MTQTANMHVSRRVAIGRTYEKKTLEMLNRQRVPFEKAPDSKDVNPDEKIDYDRWILRSEDTQRFPILNVFPIGTEITGQFKGREGRDDLSIESRRYRDNGDSRGRDLFGSALVFVWATVNKDGEVTSATITLAEPAKHMADEAAAEYESQGPSRANPNWLQEKWMKGRQVKDIVRGTRDAENGVQVKHLDDNEGHAYGNDPTKLMSYVPKDRVEHFTVTDEN